ncbi:uncharacterized protein LOC122856694 isoform X2 [Aphidius gifuensis]|uniref:uncharacterized protein LOC122856694 isoform X2 n=1 Tax=Aphidius gifuensis TaxID=684658 RepID=UPI001CDD78E8|nr:uncharacterized protein LOC122856694 isoform X2 [Aphidius gifuensis]
MFYQIFIVNLLLLSVCISVIACEGCSKSDHQKCIALADPLLKDPHLIFPDNMRDIDMVCRTWSSFVDCIKKYIDRCFTKQRREQFNAAVEEPIASVHQMCSVSTYQSEYLQYASCLKATVTEAQHCGTQYDALVDEVSQGDMARTSLCCTHYHFRACVISETRKRCDGGQSNGAASRFSRQILDRALSFLQDQCQNYIPNSADCPNDVTENLSITSVAPLDDDDPGNRGVNRRPYQRTFTTESSGQNQASSYHGVGTISTGPSPSSSSSFRNNGRSINVLPIIYRFLEDEHDNIDTQTITNIDQLITTTIINDSNDIDNNKKVDNIIGNVIEEKLEVTTVGKSIEEPVVVSHRSPSFGRGMIWSTAAPKSTKEIPAWATAGTPVQDTVTDSWFPAAGSFGGNNIDEPNQQGLKNSQMSLKINLIIVVLIAIVVYLV